jgi:hypothetical protein
MGGNINNHHDDPFAEVKVSIPLFHGDYDAETYLDWEMTVEQKFNSHLDPKCWHSLANTKLNPKHTDTDISFTREFTWDIESKE